MALIRARTQVRRPVGSRFCADGSCHCHAKLKVLIDCFLVGVRNWGSRMLRLVRLLVVFLVVAFAWGPSARNCPVRYSRSRQRRQNSPRCWSAGSRRKTTEERIVLGERLIALESAIAVWPNGTDERRRRPTSRLPSAALPRARRRCAGRQSGEGHRASGERLGAYGPGKLRRRTGPIAHNNLGMAYWSRIQGQRVDNQEKAAAHFEAALTVFSRKTHPAAVGPAAEQPRRHALEPHARRPRREPGDRNQAFRGGAHGVYAPDQPAPMGRRSEQSGQRLSHPHARRPRRKTGKRRYRIWRLRSRSSRAKPLPMIGLWRTTTSRSPIWTAHGAIRPTTGNAPSRRSRRR